MSGTRRKEPVLKTYLVSAFLILISSGLATANTMTCSLKYLDNPYVTDIVGSLVIRDLNGRVEGLLLTEYSTQLFNCDQGILDAYECYGYSARPFEAPKQLNVIGQQVAKGSVVIVVTQNLGSLQNILESRSNMNLRRFVLDVYEINSCDF